MADYSILKDEVKPVHVRYVSLKSSFRLYDLAIIEKTEKGDMLVLELNSHRLAYVNAEKVNEKGFLEHSFNVTEVEAVDLRSFLTDILG